MKRNLTAGSVEPNIRVGFLLAGIADFAEKISFGVLGTGSSHMQPEAPEEDLCLLAAPILYREARYHLETPSIVNFIAPSRDLPREGGQGEIIDRQIGRRLSRAPGDSDGCFQFVYVTGGESKPPGVVGNKIRDFPCTRAGNGSRWEG